METQSRLITESKNIVFDISKPDNLWCCNDYMLLLYLWGKLPAIPGVGLNFGMDKGKWLKAAFAPEHQERDDHAILMKNYRPALPKRVLKVMISQLIADFGDDKFNRLISEMKKIIVTKTTKSKEKQKLFDRISALPNGAGSSSLSRKIKVEVLELWFSEAITGPYCITRSLDLVSSNIALNSGAFSCETTRKIRMKLGLENFWDFDINYFNFIDKEYYVINGGDSEELNFPKSFRYHYIGVRQPGIKYKKVSEQIVLEYESDFIEGVKKNKKNEIRGVVVKNRKTGIFRIKMVYGRNIFKGMHDKLMVIVNGQGFNDWCSSKGWEIWNGRDEQSKLSDYRLLKFNLEQSKNDNQQLQQEILQLKRELERERKRNKNKNNDNDTI